MSTGFNSLRTGKCFARPPGESSYREEGRFQFPPNGKVLCKQRVTFKRGSSSPYVSIPSERESALQVAKSVKALMDQFQFPPNGKVLCKVYAFHAATPVTIVACFNSLRTGKCFASSEIRQSSYGSVSIPSERESALQVTGHYIKILAIVLGFNSLRTGKCFASSFRDMPYQKQILEFQFPPNGKVLCKRNIVRDFGQYFLFQFPPNGKVLCKA